MPPSQAEIIRIESKIDKIMTLLQGNELDPNDNGLIGMVNDVDTRVEKIERLRDKLAWVLFGMALPAGYGLTKILSAIAESIYHQ